MSSNGAIEINITATTTWKHRSLKKINASPHKENKSRNSLISGEFFKVLAVRFVSWSLSSWQVFDAKKIYTTYPFEISLLDNNYLGVYLLVFSSLCFIDDVKFFFDSGCSVMVYDQWKYTLISQLVLTLVCTVWKCHVTLVGAGVIPGARFFFLVNCSFNTKTKHTW